MPGFTLLTDTFETKGFQQLESRSAEIRNYQTDFLIANPEQSILTFKSEHDENGITLSVDTYKDFAGHRNGVPMVFSFTVDNKNYLLCVEDESLIFKEGEVPGKIPSEESELIFYQREHLEKYSTFESSAKSGFFLAFNEEDRNLILKPYPEENPDINASFYFETFGLEVFKGDIMTQIPCYFSNNNHELLIAHPESSVATFESTGHSEEEHATFYVDVYSELASSNKGLPVAISCRVNSKNYLLCATNNSVSLKEGKLPKVIPTEKSELIFYQKNFSDGQPSFRFESSLHQKNCLAWSTEGQGKKKLILKPYAENAIDETMKLDLTDKREHAPALT